MILRASYGTLALLGYVRKSVRMDTAYFMVDGKCVFDCSFCSHARNAKVDNKYLSRVIWKEVSIEDLSKLNVKRICLQVVSYKGYREDLRLLLGKLKGKRISVSVRALDLDEIDEYFSYGVDTIGLSVDVVNDELFKNIRGGSLKITKKLISDAAKKYKGKITTHVIVGMGESDKELVDFFYEMKDLNVNVALFSFTPIKGTKFEHRKSPSSERYRKIQLARYLIFEKHVSRDVFVFKNENLEEIDFGYIEGLGRAFLTSGCTYCTRPYYNEKPGSMPYNFFEYSRELEEIARGILK
ncbi:radical SAM protein [Thermosipho melanesiensis]|uniref:Radical SAM domain protein n=2 Tax=Thermosipho melanesiensis TaxID=46541 RepID=A6LJ11_THEM4|nr:radical SAM protein [Thermosipho melanesiensis]ABR29912.1 Radical SAM domain protein [Thermosipho melanesiensis BI429]APT73120.1 radical SAM protein [Thermosipho melanesiensis]OOC38519.1 radical SAM protein [Thermosipho melanesiensis]OOC40323.1 radical SAM protein [Thermosipho melanesiensis]OOC40587.1 radical SAM protein [Thermosipho melanesiensis]